MTPEPLRAPARVRAVVGPVLGWLLAAAGCVMLFLGWWGVSGTPLPGKQIPYLVSGGLGGLALLVLAAAWFASHDLRSQLRGLQALEAQVAELHRLLTEEPTDSSEECVAVPSGTSYHRSGCRLVQGSDRAQVVTAAQVRRRGLAPCRLCDPELA